MTACPYCNKKVPEGATVCPRCKAALPKEVKQTEKKSKTKE